MTRRNARLLSLAGLLVALIGLVGFWLSRDIERGTLSADQRELLGLADDDFHVSFVVAGRDIFYANDGADPILAQDGTIIGWRPINPIVHDGGTQTDTILYVDITGNDISIIALPRDLWVNDLGHRINAAYHLTGAEGLRRRVEAVLGVPVDYYAIVKLNIFQGLVDALGGVTVDVPYRMRYSDQVGGLHIDFPAGPRHMNGEDASKFIRYRNTVRSDFDRLDNVKRMAYAMMQRVKELNLRAITAIPALVDTFFSDVETNISLALVRQLAARATSLELSVTATLPVEETVTASGAAVVVHDPATVNHFMAATFGGVARDFASAPDLDLLITDRSGTPGIGDWYRDRLVALGIPGERIMVRVESDIEPSSTRLLTTLESWEAADFYAELLHASKQQVDRLQPYARRAVHLELVLGSDAASRATYSEAVIASLERP